MSELTPLEAALREVLEQARVLDQEKVMLHALLGRVLAEDVRADADNPPFDNAAMDGYAVRGEDVEGASEESPVRLRLVGEFPAGAAGEVKVTEGTAVSIFTGAPVPAGADTVVPVEYTERRGDSVIVRKAFRKGANVRRRGEDLRRGDLVLRRGEEIRGYEIGLLASVNRAVVSVYRKPRVGILSTGDELVELGEDRDRSSQIRSSNHHMLYSLVESAGGVPHLIGIAPDDPEKLRDLLRRCYSYDIFITTGGVSMGERDYVQHLVEEVGIRIRFHRLRIKPAKPVLFGTYGERGLFFGLPGNPVSCAVAFDLLVYPAIRSMLGAREVFKRKISAVLVRSYSRRDAGRREFARARVWHEGGRYLCEPAPKQQSHMLTSYVGANAYLIVPEGVREIAEGQEAEVVLL